MGHLIDMKRIRNRFLHYIYLSAETPEELRRKEENKTKKCNITSEKANNMDFLRAEIERKKKQIEESKVLVQQILFLQYKHSICVTSGASVRAII